MSKREMKLGAFLMVPGHHVAAWRHPDADVNGVLNLSFYKELAQTAERGKFDMVFLADSLAAKGNKSIEGRAVNATFEPLTLLSALSAVTDRIGLAATVSTTYNEPYHVARKFASLDHLSNGRAGWNVVTSGSEIEALNFGKENHLLHELRYDRAKEFLDVVSGLWDTWDDDAVVKDKESGVFSAPDKIRALDHKGEWFQVQGPLNISRPPQGNPVIIQAGASESGRDFAAQYAEAIFTAWQTFDEAKQFYTDVKGRLQHYGRTAEDVKIMPGVFPIIGRTEEEADELEAKLKELIHPTVGVALLSGLISYDLSPYPVDGPLPELPDLSQINGQKSRFLLLKDIADRESYTIRQLYQHIAGARGHWSIKGTPVQIADQLEAWFNGGAADGFNVMAPYLPGGLTDFVDLVIPELQRRDLFRKKYTGSTLREHLGLRRPVSRSTKQPLQHS